MQAIARLAPLALIALLGVARPAVAQDAAPRAPARRVSVGPFIGSAPGASPVGPRVPTVGLASDLALVRIGRLGLHAGGTLEHRAGALMTGLIASAVLPVRGPLALRAGAAVGRAEVQRDLRARELGWRAWRGVDAALELRMRRTIAALVVRSGTLDRFGYDCPPSANCIGPGPDVPPARFTRVSLESRYTFF